MPADSAPPPGSTRGPTHRQGYLFTAADARPQSPRSARQHHAPAVPARRSAVPTSPRAAVSRRARTCCAPPRAPAGSH
eukprot:3807665-Prymnesium_polylepis.4